MDTTTMSFKIQTMSESEVALTIDWAAAEGWNPGIHDAESFYAADNNGFFVGMLDAEPIAVISVVKYGASFGFLGLYIVKPEYRGQGYGLQIWKAGMKYLAGRNVGLDGVVEQQENYKKSGFKLAYRNLRYQGGGGGEFPKPECIIKLSEIPFADVEAYDRQFFPEERTAFLNAWLSQTDSTALGFMHDNKLAGLGVIRKCRNGHKIGPLYADTPEIAETIFQTLKSTCDADETVSLDVPEVNQTAINLADKYKMKVAFQTARMYTGEPPKIDLNRTYGVTTFELG
jgi:GNAT superfamily N-acetyltransferase